MQSQGERQAKARPEDKATWVAGLLGAMLGAVLGGVVMPDDGATLGGRLARGGEDTGVGAAGVGAWTACRHELSSHFDRLTRRS